MSETRNQNALIGQLWLHSKCKIRFTLLPCSFWIDKLICLYCAVENATVFVERSCGDQLVPQNLLQVCLCNTAIETSSKVNSVFVNRSNLGKSNSKRHHSKVGVWGTKQRSPVRHKKAPPSIEEKEDGFEEEVEYEAAATTTNTTSVTSPGRMSIPKSPSSPSSTSNKSEKSESSISDSAPISFSLNTSILFDSSFLATTLASSSGFAMDLEKSDAFPMEEMDACEVVDVVATAKDKLEEESEDEDEDSIKVAVVSASEDVRTIRGKESFM